MKFSVLPLTTALLAAIDPALARDTFYVGVQEAWEASPLGGANNGRTWSIGAINRQTGQTDTDKSTGIGRSVYDICGANLFGAQVQCFGDLTKQCSDYGVAAYNWNWCRTRCVARGDPPASVGGGWIANFWPKAGQAFGADLICDSNF